MSGQEQNQPEGNEDEGKKIFRVGKIGTAVLVAVLVGLLVVRLPEWWPLRAPVPPGAEEPARLTLSEIGNVLAGIFAPLAFLWLFVATMLQRRELGLQRKELKLQRRELALTRDVLQKTAKANAETAKASADQAKMMQHSLSVSQKSSQYEYFSSVLYYTAIHWMSINRKIALPTDGTGFVFFGRDFGTVRDINDPGGVDAAFGLLKQILEYYENRMDQGHFFDGPLDRNQDSAYEDFRKFKKLVDMMKNIDKVFSQAENEIIVFRFEFLEFTKMNYILEGLYSKSKERLQDQFPGMIFPKETP